MEDKGKKKKVNFFCCGSGSGNKRRKDKEDKTNHNTKDSKEMKDKIGDKK